LLPVSLPPEYTVQTLWRESPFHSTTPEWMWVSLAGSKFVPPSKAKTRRSGVDALRSRRIRGWFASAQ
jgi:hypothetical protein